MAAHLQGVPSAGSLTTTPKHTLLGLVVRNGILGFANFNLFLVDLQCCNCGVFRLLVLRVLLLRVDHQILFSKMGAPCLNS